MVWVKTKVVKVVQPSLKDFTKAFEITHNLTDIKRVLFSVSFTF